MSVECLDTTISVNDGALHFATWKDRRLKPSSVFLLIHGIMMHGKSFDNLARSLASKKALVLAPDLRGFGRFYHSEDSKQRKTDYNQSLNDLAYVLHQLAERYPDLPIFCAGESLGATLARNLVSLHPEFFSGLILSSPCVRPRILSLPLIPHACSELILTGINPGRPVDLSPFARQFLKYEEGNLKDYLEDPLTRKSLEVLELIDSLQFVGSNRSMSIPGNIPILVLRGKNDGVCTYSSSKRFLEDLDSSNMTIHNCNTCGHIVLQSSLVEPKILSVIERWQEKVLAMI